MNALYSCPEREEIGAGPIGSAPFLFLPWLLEKSGRFCFFTVLTGTHLLWIIIVLKLVALW